MSGVDWKDKISRGKRKARRVTRMGLLRGAGLLCRLADRFGKGPLTTSVSAPPCKGEFAPDMKEQNRAFAEHLARESRLGRDPGPGVTTYTEDVLEFFEGGLASRMYQSYVLYALRSPARGEKVVHEHEHELDRIRRYLDIGCAYGGSVIAMAKVGVPETVGIEYDGRLLTLARKQSQELGVADQVRLYEGDLTKTAQMREYGTFDLVTCTDVLEHVMDPEAAITSLGCLVSEGGVLTVDVPNMWGHHAIRADPHHHILGSILLEREDAIRVFENEFPGNKRYTVGYFHPLEWYMQRLEQAGFEVTLADAIDDSRPAALVTAGKLSELLAEGRELVRTREWPIWRKALLESAMQRLEARLEEDRPLVETDPRVFQMRYSVAVYHFRCLRRQELSY